MADNKNKEATRKEWQALYAQGLYPGETVDSMKRRGFNNDLAYPNEGGVRIHTNATPVPGLQVRQIGFK